MRNNRPLTVASLALTFASLFFHKQGVAAEGIDHLVPAQSAVFCEQRELERYLHIRKALRLDDEGVPGGRDALVEVVTGKSDGEKTDSLLSLDRKMDEHSTRSRFWLEWREASDDGIAAPKSWKIEIDKELAEAVHSVWTKAVRDAHFPEPTKTFIPTSQWFRCHTDKEGYRCAVMPAFITPDGRLQAMSWAVVFAAKWVKSEAKNEEMKKRFR
jgi:hypothetical protein